MDTSGVNRLAVKLEKLGDEFESRLYEFAKDEANTMRDYARSLVYGPHLRYVNGETADSIHEYAEQTEEGISFGSVTNNLRTIYHELGTGPVGTAAGYPGEENVDAPIVRRSTPWTYWSDSIPTADGGRRSGFVETEGVPPKGFMHAATVMEMPEAERMVLELLKEFLSG